MAVGVLHHDQLLAHLHLNRQLLLQLTADRFNDRLTGLLLAAGEFPQPPQQTLIEPLIDQHLTGAVAHHPHADHLERQLAGGIHHGVAAAWGQRRQRPVNVCGTAN